MVPMISGKSPKVAGSNNGPQLVPKTLVPTSCKNLIVVGINEKIMRKVTTTEKTAPLPIRALAIF
jgi:hypothetical protein